jgi:hypothetical protein
MPNSVKSSSNTPEDHQERDSVYDFLYQDVRRVGSYLAQLTPSGHVQSVKQTKSTESAEHTDVQASAAASAVVAKAEGKLSAQIGTKNADGLERMIDPLWANAIDLLNLVDQRGILHRDAKKARIGQFVLVSGELGLIDLSHLSLVWGTPELRTACERSFAAGLKNDPASEGLIKTFIKQNNKTTSEQDFLALAKFMINVFKELPESIQGRISDGEGNLFSFSLREDGLISTPTDLFLKHGIVIAGMWAVVGILDAQPDNAADQDNPPGKFLGLTGNPLVSLLKGVAGLGRQVGRPDNAFGITPLLIFRTAGD